VFISSIQPLAYLAKNYFINPASNKQRNNILYYLGRTVRGTNRPGTNRPYTVGVNSPKCYRQLRVKDLPQVPSWRLE